MSKHKVPVREMLPVAYELVRILAPKCTRIAVAGSIRRGEDLVGDIEIVCAPAGEALEGLFADLLRWKTVEKRHKSNGHLLAWGPRYKALVYQRVPVDVFIVLPDRQWGPTYLIRTGPGEANDCLVTGEGIRNREGRIGILPKGMAFRDGAVYRGAERLDTPEEQDVFAACGLPYVPPVLRSYALYRALYRGEPMEPFSLAWLDGKDDLFINGQRKVMTVQVAAQVEAPPVQQSLF